MSLRWRVLFACSLGVLFAIGVPLGFQARGAMPHYLLLSSNTGIAAGKHLFLDYFVDMPWPIINVDHIAYFQETAYLGHRYEPDTVPLLIFFKSGIFFLGALLAMVLSGEEKKELNENLQWTSWRHISLPPFLAATLRGHPPPWMLYTLLLGSAHVLLIGVATTYYTGPGGPVWVFPSPVLLIPFGLGTGVLAFFTQAICTTLRKEITVQSFLSALGMYITLTVLYYLIFRVGCVIAWNVWH